MPTDTDPVIEALEAWERLPRTYPTDEALIEAVGSQLTFDPYQNGPRVGAAAGYAIGYRHALSQSRDRVKELEGDKARAVSMLENIAFNVNQAPELYSVHEVLENIEPVVAALTGGK